MGGGAVKIRRGTVMVIRDGWDKAGRVGVALGAPVYVGQDWVPILFRDDEDPDFYKLAGLEVLIVKAPPRPSRSGANPTRKA